MELLESTEPYLCLNMIVKNEGHIIKDTLTKLLKKIPAIDYWVISDTGSTDKTKEIISEFFKERNIKGELFDDEWKDFGHNRTLALEHAFGKSKYLLIFDADDEICGDFVLPDLIVDSYNLQFGDANGASYTRTQIVNNKKKWKYVGVLHEIITCCEHSNNMVTIKGNYYTISGRTSYRNHDKNKYLNDALILEKAYEEAVKNNDELYNRYGFYCANSYYDCGKWGDAIKWYKITLGNNNWSQEKYIACQRLYNCYNTLNEKEKGIYYLVKSFAYDKERAECLQELITYYCRNDMNEVAYSYYNIAKSFYNERYLKDGLNDKLFLDVSKANLFLPYYMILVSDKVKDHDTTIQMYRIIFTTKHIERSKHYIGNMLYNLQFFIERVKDDKEFLRLFQEYVEFLISIDYPVYEHKFMVNYEKYGIINRYSVISVFKKEEYLKNKKILIYTGYMNFLWNDSTVKTQSIGGAEKAVVYLSRQFPKDYDIYIVGDQLEEQIDNIRYINRNKLQQLLNQNEFHTIIISRYVSFFEEYNNIKCYKLLLYAHDSTGFINNYNRTDINYILEQCNDYLDKVVCLTNWHSNNIIQRHPFLKDKIEIINNGINIVDFPTNKIQKISNKFLWSSCAYRGLHILLNLWSDILNILPDATLDICSYDSFPKNKEEEEMLKIINSYDSITYRGKLNTSELYDLMAKSEYWLYTNTFPETSCITGMEMLMSEVICLYYPLAGLVDTVGVYGIPVERGQEIETIVNLTNKRKTEIRKLGKEYALSCSWENRAKKWAKLLFLDNDSLNIEKRTFTNNNIENTKFIDYNIEYGVDDNKINITHTVISHSLNKEFIEIPTNDILRAELYGDPCWGVVKSIYITTKDGSVTKCKDNYPIILDWQGILIKKPNFKYKLSACLLIKNETENLNDWIEHYINEGVEHFFITSNNSTDGIDNFILNSEYKNMITLITDNRDINIYNDQVKHREILCKNFYNIIKNSTEWCILVDIDEFMYGKNGYTLSSFIDTLDEDIGCFYVYWNIFKPTLDSENNISDKFSLKKSCKRINLDLISDLSYEIKFVSKFGKSIFRTSMLQEHIKLWIHKVTTSGKIITNYGNISNYKYDNDDDIYWSESNYKNVNVALNHYAIRNKKDYDNKSNQLENTHRYPFVKGLLDIYELDNKYIIEDEYILNKYRIPEERIIYSKKINKIGIFNSFPFHYEMFGFILNYAQKNNYEVDIFTNKNKSLGWFEFYKEQFNNFKINEIGKFNGETSEYATFFLTTDDDTQFKSEWIRDNVVCVNHYYRIRTSNFKHYLNVANFKDSTLEYVYPCYPLINYRDKIQNSTNVCIIGGGNIHHNHNINVINRLQSNGRIKLNIFVRKDCKTNISELEINKFDINFIEDISTSKMIQILNQSSYVLVNYNNNQDHNNGISCSGSLQLALSTLCKPIIINTANKYLQIKNALEYDIKSNEPIFIDKEIDLQLLEEERNNYVDKFDKYIGNILSQLKVKNNFEHDEVNISLLDNIKEYKPIYQHFLDRSNAEIMFRKLIYNIMPYFKDKNIIDLGAYIGDNSIPWAMNSTGIIYAIDPSKENTDFIDKMAKHNRVDNVITITKAISDKREVIYYNEIDTTHVSCNTDNGENFFEAVTLDSLNLENIGFIHLDVEGFEFRVLNGSINLITKYNPIVVWENHIEREDYMKIVNFFSHHKYSTYMINEQFPHCFPDCRNFISFPENCNISVNELNNKFKEVYTEFTPDKKSPLLTCIKSHITSDIPNKNIIKQDSNNKNLCLLTYGQLRTFKNNFRNNLLELYPVYTEYENVYIFILLDELSSNEEVVRTVYKENCDYIENICKEFNIKIGFIQDINNLNYKQEEMNYCSKLLLQKSDDKKEFPNNFVLNLLYRKYKLIELVEEYCIDHKVAISNILYARLFDVIIKKNISANTILNNLKNTDLRKTIYFSPDTIFFGNHNLIKKSMKFENIYNSDELWNNKDFCNFSHRFDSILTNNKCTYAPEIQYTANMYFQSIDAINLRYYKPDMNCLDANLMYEVILDPNRINSTIYDINNKVFNLNLTSEYILELNNSIDSNYLEYFNKSGVNDYKQKIGGEHYKLLCAISCQINNGIIIDIGTHNGNSAVALGYNLYKNKNNILDRSILYTFDITDLKSEPCKKFMNNYCIHSSLENIFEHTIKDKYKNALLESKLIMIDIDPHNGVLEYELYSWLFENNYKGIILFDDIFLEKGHTANNYQATYQSMKIFWNKIPDKYKLDITHIGHWSGTGLVSFNTNNIIKLDSNNIPSKIFQTWETRDIETEFQQIINKWKENNPNYEYIFHDAEQRVQFIQDNFKENVLNAYKKIIPGAYKCDLWRYCVLYIYGGFYADIDTLCMGKLNNLTNKNIEFIVPIDLNINPREGEHNLACGFIGSVPKSPILLDAIDRIVFNVENNIIPTSKLDFSGPGLLGRAVNKFLNLDETSSFKGKEGIRNNINFLEFDPNTEYMKDVYADSTILQNKNKNSDIIRLYNNECNKIKNYTCWLSNNIINTDL